MSYNVDELFGFEFNTFEGGYGVVDYLKKDDPTITELEIPAEYNSEPVTSVYGFSDSKYLKRVVIPPSVRVVSSAGFYNCKSLETAELSEGLEIIGGSAFEGTGLKTAELPEGLEGIGYWAFRGSKLKSVVLPKSLKCIYDRAFANCIDLESVTFNSTPSLEEKVFFNCLKLPAEVALMGLVNSCDISEPFDEEAFYTTFSTTLSNPNEHLNYTSPEVFRLAVKNNCFRSVDISIMLNFLVEIGDAKSLCLAGEHGMLDNAAFLDMLTERSAEKGKTEITAYLLEYKKRKFGFNGGNNFEL